MTMAKERIRALFKELVPVSGKADTVAGEIIRAVSRIVYRNNNGGDHIGVGYGKETCNSAARYLMARGGVMVEAAVMAIWGEVVDSHYDTGISVLEEAVLEYLDQYPELKTTDNIEDMWDYYDEDEDVDDYEEDEDYE